MKKYGFICGGVGFLIGLWGSKFSDIFGIVVCSFSSILLMIAIYNWNK